MIATVRLADRLADLLRPDAFDHPARDLRLIETHISWIILAGNYAYKLHKPVNFGFLDFSSPELRRADCEAEVRLNSRLSPELYIGVVDVVERNGRLYVGGPGVPVEAAVQMHRLPEAGMLTSLIERGAIEARLMERIAGDLATFHATAPTGPGVDENGSPAAIAANWEENFAQTTRLPLAVLPPATRATIEDYVATFLESNKQFLERRVGQGRIRDGHGDLHAGSVCATRRSVFLFDCVEFNTRFRCADVAADVAFLAMDLEHLGRADLSAAFVDAYVRRSEDRELHSLLDFYKCYRAFVRGKVLGFRLDEPDLDPAEAAQIAREARAYFDLAHAYAKPEVQPVLLVIMGLPASGKSSLASAIAGRFGMVHLSSDVVRKHLAGVRPTVHRLDGFGRGIYSRSMTRRTYAVLKRTAARWLRGGKSVVLDATFGQPAERAAVRVLARRAGARLIVVVCRADEATIRARLAARSNDPLTTSDARLELWPALRGTFVEPTELPDVLSVCTTEPLETSIETIVSAVRVPRVAHMFTDGKPYRNLAV